MEIYLRYNIAVFYVLFPWNFHEIVVSFYQSLRSCGKYVYHFVVIYLHKQRKVVLSWPLWKCYSCYQLIVLKEFESHVELSTWKFQSQSLSQRNWFSLLDQNWLNFLISLYLHIKRTNIKYLHLLWLDTHQSVFNPVLICIHQRHIW